MDIHWISEQTLHFKALLSVALFKENHRHCSADGAFKEILRFKDSMVESGGKRFLKVEGGMCGIVTTGHSNYRTFAVVRLWVALKLYAFRVSRAGPFGGRCSGRSVLNLHYEHVPMNMFLVHFIELHSLNLIIYEPHGKNLIVLS